MPFTFPIANGISARVHHLVLLHAMTGRVRGMHPLMWLVATAFIVYFVVD